MKRANKKSDPTMNLKLHSGKRLKDATEGDLVSSAEIDRLIAEKLQEKATILRMAAEIMGNRTFAEALRAETDPARRQLLMDGIRLAIESKTTAN